MCILFFLLKRNSEIWNVSHEGPLSIKLRMIGQLTRESKKTEVHTFNWKTYIVTTKPDFIHALCNWNQEFNVKFLAWNVYIWGNFTSCNKKILKWSNLPLRNPKPIQVSFILWYFNMLNFAVLQSLNWEANFYCPITIGGGAKRVRSSIDKRYNAVCGPHKTSLKRRKGSCEGYYQKTPFHKFDIVLFYYHSVP